MCREGDTSTSGIGSSVTDLHAVVAEIERASEEAVKQWTEQARRVGKVVERGAERRRAGEVDKQNRQYKLTLALEVILAMIGGLLCLASLVP